MESIFRYLVSTQSRNPLKSHGTFGGILPKSFGFHIPNEKQSEEYHSSGVCRLRSYVTSTLVRGPRPSAMLRGIGEGARETAPSLGTILITSSVGVEARSERGEGGGTAGERRSSAAGAKSGGETRAVQITSLCFHRLGRKNNNSLIRACTATLSLTPASALPPVPVRTVAQQERGEVHNSLSARPGRARRAAKCKSLLLR